MTVLMETKKLCSFFFFVNHILLLQYIHKKVWFISDIFFFPFLIHLLHVFYFRLFFSSTVVLFLAANEYSLFLRSVRLNN